MQIFVRERELYVGASVPAYYTCADALQLLLVLRLSRPLRWYKMFVARDRRLQHLRSTLYTTN